MQITATSWTLRLGHFLSGDVSALVDLIDGFDRLKPDNRYVLSNERGDGRVMASAPVLSKSNNGFYELSCPVEPRAPRIDARSIGTDIALRSDTNDIFPSKSGDIATVSGLDALPQRLRTALSIQRGEHFFEPTYGARLLEYFETYRGSPWLDLLFKLDVVRQAAIPHQDAVFGKAQTPLLCVTQVREVQILADAPTNNRLPIRLELESDYRHYHRDPVSRHFSR